MEGWPEPWYRILWAPWRMKYIQSASETARGCIFCIAPSMSDEEALIVYRGRNAYIILNKYPYNTGHLMIVPYRHVPSLEDLNTEELLELSELVKASLKALREVYRPHGFNVGVNIGEAAGAGVAGHVHVHIVPRWRGDSNFMLTVGGVKVLPESLDATFKKVKPAIEKALTE
ncbi:MAG: HIT domain-containing protein [Desulfurococcales archaeon]|nr:HIT domain-containing protein [Desulfurococcales archaeon]